MKPSFVHIPRALALLAVLVVGADYRIQYQPRQETILAHGVYHRHYSLDGPNRVDVIEIHRNRSSVELVAWRSGGLQRTSAQARDASAHFDHVLAAINADFFSFETTWPIGYQVTDGEFVHATPSARSHLLVGPDGEIRFDRPTFRGRLVTATNDTLVLHGVNRRRNGVHAVWYNAHAGNRVRSDSSGFVLRMDRLDDGRTVVRAKDDGYGPASVDGFLVSVGPRHPDISAFRKVSVGDTLALWMGFDNPLHQHARQALGGGGMILENGQPVQELNESRERLGRTFMTARHPRTLVATNADRSIVWMVTVDGRQESSIGMTFSDMADFLLSLGATDALNLDGGGSTAMVVDGQVVNRPSDITGERAVANVLLLVRR